jgi:hypothetical protein
MKKLLKAWIVLGDRQPPRLHDREERAPLQALLEAELERCEQAVDRRPASPVAPPQAARLSSNEQQPQPIAREGAAVEAC